MFPSPSPAAPARAPRFLSVPAPRPQRHPVSGP
ncbi:hypothetical protein chiPu_0026959, partial [Chiloscyllium punctatum]|nr:hypothetical protein [Chiloscyllium punctatum]